MFIGKYSHNLDDKSRLTVPAKFRENLGSNAVMTFGFDKCVAIYTAEEWQKFMDKLDAMDENKSDIRKYKRVFTGYAFDCECDSHGRVIIPAELKKITGINKEVVLIGVSNCIEVWSKERWDSYEDEATSNLDEIAEKLSEL